MKTFSSDNAIRFAASRLAPRFSTLRRPRYVTYILAPLLFAPVEIFAFELGDASLRSALGEPLLVEIPYRLTADEQLTPACVKLVPPRSPDALPTYTRSARIAVSSTAIEISDKERVIEPLIGLTIDITCATAPHFIRTYELLVDLPAQQPAIRFASTPRQSTTEIPAPVAAARGTESSVVARETSPVAAADHAASAPPATAVRAHATARSRGHAGGNVAQGQTYRVVRGDTLSGIAARVADRPTTIRETSDAIFAANVNAFTHGNPDLIEEGRSLVIPTLTRTTDTAVAVAPALATATVAAPQGGSGLPNDPPVSVEPIPAPPVAPQPPRAEEPANIVASGTSEQPPAEVKPVAASAPEPVVARTAVEPAPDADSQSEQNSPWLTGLVGFVIGIVLAAPVFIVQRRRQQAALSKAREDAKKRLQRRLAPTSGIEVVESRMTEIPADEKPTPKRSAPAEPVARERSREPNNVKPPAKAVASQEKTMTFQKLDVLRQDDKAERTLTQQLSPTLRGTVADLEATSTREATKPTSLLDAEDMAALSDSTTVRIRSKQ